MKINLNIEVQHILIAIGIMIPMSDSEYRNSVLSNHQLFMNLTVRMIIKVDY